MMLYLEGGIMKSNLEFISYLKSLVSKNTVYMWGEYGRLVTNNTISSKARQYPSHYDDAKKKYLKSLVNKNYYAYDCAGLIKSYFMSNYGDSNVKYSSKYDKNAYGITIGCASEKGNIKNMPEIPGLLLYMDGHCGVYIGNGYVIEATSNQKISGKKYGCVCMSKLSDRKWEKWVKSKWLSYEKMIKYTIKKGDTLSSIARLYNTTWQKIYEKNKNIIKDPNKIYPGQIITI